MLDLATIRERSDRVRQALADRGTDFDLGGFLEEDTRRRELIQQVETLRAERNEASKAIGRIKREGGDADEIMERSRLLAERLGELEGDLEALEAGAREALLLIPNLPHESVPVGPNESANREERRWGQPPDLGFEPRDHVEIGETLGILDMVRAAKVSGARFSAQFGMGARLERALAAYMLDLHAERGYLEVLTPYLVTAESMLGSGQLPKFADDSFFVEKDGFYLIPTSEVPLVNLHREEMLEAEQLPIRYCAYTPCFRREAGSYGRDTRGLIRVHQFNKVELVWLTEAERSWEALESLTADAERVLQGLEIPYRVVTLATGDMGFSAAKTYDIEAWLPSQGRYREISSCSNCTDFQARRAGIRYRPAGGGKARLAHTLNGSGVAVGRALVALLENHQRQDGTVLVPEALRPYLGGMEVVEPLTRPGR